MRRVHRRRGSLAGLVGIDAVTPAYKLLQTVVPQGVTLNLRHTDERVARQETPTMTKKLLLMLAAVAGLSGCVAVPVYDAPPVGVYYGPPAASVTFGYYGHGPQHRHYRGPRYRYRH